jgi:hypothetical protein
MFHSPTARDPAASVARSFEVTEASEAAAHGHSPDFFFFSRRKTLMSS